MVTIVDYGDSNAFDVAEAIKKITPDFLITQSEMDICRADKIIFPGSGSAFSAMKKIHLLNLYSVMRIIKKPILGIGLGMQMMAGYSTEGNISCLGIYPGTAVKFKNGTQDPVNEGFFKVTQSNNSKLFEGLSSDDEFYFNHSYYIPDNEYTTTTCIKDVPFSSSLEKDSAFGVQFHPEKSGESGLKLLKNFIDL